MIIPQNVFFSKFFIKKALWMSFRIISAYTEEILRKHEENKLFAECFNKIIQLKK